MLSWFYLVIGVGGFIGKRFVAEIGFKVRRRDSIVTVGVESEWSVPSS